jgi:hypothetical protein
VKNGTVWECQISGDSTSTASTSPSKSSSGVSAAGVTGAGTATALPSTQNKSGLSAGSKAGIGVCVTLAVAALLGILAFILFKTGILSSITGGILASLQQ